MSELVADCPRCGSQNMTFDLKQQHFIREEYNWQHWYEAFCVCRHCHRSTIFVLSELKPENRQSTRNHKLPSIGVAVNTFMSVEGHVSLKDVVNISPPDHLPRDIEEAFNEGSSCLSIGCYNASGTMFRLCVDLATRSLLPDEGETEPNARIRRSLGLRMKWLLDNGRLPKSLRDLSSCIKEDGNDGAHEGSLTKDDVEDLIDFAAVLLERLYTEPERLRIAQERRAARRSN